MGISRPRGMGVYTMEALEAAETLGYPVLPSYVIGGQNMVIANDRGDVERYMSVILSGGSGYSILIDKYMPGGRSGCDIRRSGRAYPRHYGAY